jgi:hypothetical protein
VNWAEIGGGDCVAWTGGFIPGGAIFDVVLTLAGPRARQFRAGYSYASAARIRTSTEAHIDTLAVVAASDAYNATMERFELNLHLIIHASHGALLGDHAMDVEFDVLSYPVTDAYPPIDLQLWDDDLIAAFGEIPQQLTNRCAQSYDAASIVGTDEMEFVRRSSSPVTAVLAGMDLRPEPGDPLTVGLPERGADADIWVQRVTQAWSRTGGETRLEGYLI